MRLTSGGGVKAALKAMLLGPDFERTLREVEAEFADGVPLPRLETVYTAEKAVLAAYPAAELIFPGSEPEPESSVQHYAHQVAVVFTMIGTDEETLTAQIERYVLATRRMVFQELLSPFLGASPVVCGREDYSPLGRHRELATQFVKSGAIDLFVTTFNT